MYFSMVSNSNLIIHLPKISILTPLLFLSTHYLLINLLSLIHNLKPISSPNKPKLTKLSLPNHNDCNETLSITFLAKLIVL